MTNLERVSLFVAIVAGLATIAYGLPDFVARVAPKSEFDRQENKHSETTSLEADKTSGGDQIANPSPDLLDSTSSPLHKTPNSPVVAAPPAEEAEDELASNTSLQNGKGKLRPVETVFEVGPVSVSCTHQINASAPLDGSRLAIQTAWLNLRDEMLVLARKKHTQKIQCKEVGGETYLDIIRVSEDDGCGSLKIETNYSLPGFKSAANCD